MDQALLAQEEHIAEYKKRPSVTAVANGRFHLIGEHSWFAKDKTLSMAVDLPVYVCISARQDAALRFYFSQLEDRKKSTLPSIKFRKEDKWANAIKAIVYGFTSGGFELNGMDFTIYSEVLPSAGCGITTAIKIACAYAIRKLFNLPCSDAQLLQVIERGNKLFLNIENYIADNFAAIYSKEGNVVLTDYGKYSCDLIPFDFEDKVILLTDAKVPRVEMWNEESIQQPENVLLLGELKERKTNAYGGWIYEDNPTEINEVLSVVKEDMRRRLTCIMKEHNFVMEAQKSLNAKEFGGFARAVNHSHKSMRDGYELSCPEIDWILKRLQEINPNIEDSRNPVSCGRITGKGFGRMTYTIMNRCDEENFRNTLVEYEKIFGFKPSCYEVKPSGGVKILG
ncbi:galactokinase [Treponema pectinovorum]|uniref:galactokinase n=1 Tax=Treponema pectinovorum TaxID=164 RepID=UPI0011C9E698|nr:galactokinase family protein [Treponema pectinovorum]